MLGSMHAWFFWDKHLFVFDYITALIGLIYVMLTPANRRISTSIIFVFVLFYMSTVWRHSIGAEVLDLHPSFFILLLLNRLEHCRLLSLWTTIFAAILGVSFVAWLVVSMGNIFFNLPNFGIITYSDTAFINYILCVWKIDISQRFNSIFVEPGHTAMIAAFTIAVNRFDFKKWQVVVIFITTLFTLSLAGYILIAIGYFMYATFSNRSLKKVLSRYLIYSIVLFAAYQISINYNNGNNLVNELIVDRLEYDEEKVIAGNNRFHGNTDKVFETFLSSEQVVGGYSEVEYRRMLANETIKGAGYKLFFLQKGIYGFILIVLVYWLLLKNFLDKRLGLTMLAIYFMAFLQRAYPYWESWLFLFLFASSLEISNNSFISKHKKVLLKK